LSALSGHCLVDVGMAIQRLRCSKNSYLFFVATLDGPSNNLSHFDLNYFVRLLDCQQIILLDYLTVKKLFC